MKRFTFLLITLCLAGLFASSAVGQVCCFPSSTYMQLIHGWWNNEPVWFISTDTNNIRFAQACDLTLAPKLSSAIEADAAGNVFITEGNVNNTEAVFDTVPGFASYTPLFRVNYIRWNDPGEKRPVTNADPASDTNPSGLPGLDEAQIIPTDIVINTPILAVGQLGGPWYPAPEGRYRIPQVLSFDQQNKIVQLPLYPVYCRNFVTRRIEVVPVLITDASNPELAAYYKANMAQRLRNMPTSDTEAFYRFLAVNGLMPQCSLIEACPEIRGRMFFDLVDSIAVQDNYSLYPTPCSWRNVNFVYSPIMNYNEVLKSGTRATINNVELLKKLDNYNMIQLVNSDFERLNAPVVCPQIFVIEQ